jgi:hypothetical protein
VRIEANELRAASSKVLIDHSIAPCDQSGDYIFHIGFVGVSGGSDDAADLVIGNLSHT